MRPLLISGPTGAGKSAFALAEAQKGGVIINADASQVYDGWRILTARPSEEEEAAAPHRLYGHVDAAERYSVGAWLRDLEAELAVAREAGSRPIIIGGTGLYFAAALDGLAPIPPTPPLVREMITSRFAAEGLPALAAELAARDPETAAATDLMNPKRVARALEVIGATGRGLASWRAETGAPLIGDADKILILPDRPALYERLDRRFGEMLEKGALAEARAMRARKLDPDLPSMKAVGAPELFAHLGGRMSLDEAAAGARRATRNYAKRQMTWMRNRMKDWRMVGPAGRG